MSKFVSSVVLFVCLFQGSFSIKSSYASDKLEVSHSKVIRAALLLEVFTIADGTHFYFPEAKSDAVEKEHRATALAATELWFKLRSMERVSRILQDAVIYVRSNLDDLKNFSRSEAIEQQIYNDLEFQREMVRSVFNQIEVGFKADSALYAEFSDLKRKAEQVTSPPLGKAIYVLGTNASTTDPKIIDQFLSQYPVKRTMPVNKVFVMYIDKPLRSWFMKSQYNRTITARSIISLASQPGKEEPVQSIYQAALEKVTQLAGQNDNCTTTEIFFKYSDVLFSTLTDLFGKQPALNTELESLKQNLLASNAENEKKLVDVPVEVKCRQPVYLYEKPIKEYSLLVFEGE